MVADLLCIESKEWNRRKIEGVLPNLLPDILLLKPSITGERDSYAWLASKSGDYSTKSGYLVATSRLYASVGIDSQLSLPGPTATTLEWQKHVWSGACAPKLKVFMWKILQGALPIGENLRKRGMLLNNVFCRCGKIETADHLFLHCQFEKDVWASSLLQQNPNVHEFLSFKEALISLHGVVSLPPIRSLD